MQAKTLQHQRSPNRSLKRLREILGLTQAEFAQDLGVSSPTIAAVEVGTNALSIDLNWRIADRFGATLKTFKRCTKQGRSDPPYKAWVNLEGDGVLEAGCLYGEPKVEYTEQSQRRWRERLESPDYWLRTFTSMTNKLADLLLAASNPSETNSLPRLPGLVRSFEEWARRAEMEPRPKPHEESPLP